MLTTAVTSAAATAAQTSEREPVKLLRKIGSTVYTVYIYPGNSSGETLDDKIMRLIRRELETPPATKPLQTERLPEGGSQ
jgi:hypothetical protein